MTTTPKGQIRDPVNPRGCVAEHDLHLDVEEALGWLTPGLRTAVVLVDVAGRPVAEAAGLLGVPVGTVKSRRSRGRAQLAVLIGPPGQGTRRLRPPSQKEDTRMRRAHRGSSPLPEVGPSAAAPRARPTPSGSAEGGDQQWRLSLRVTDADRRLPPIPSRRVAACARTCITRTPSCWTPSRTESRSPAPSASISRAASHARSRWSPSAGSVRTSPAWRP
ncbi:sigma factor-like helix-turn-helix DNA-binding protein [Frankia sp. CcWB2]